MIITQKCQSKHTMALAITDTRCQCMVESTMASLDTTIVLGCDIFEIFKIELQMEHTKAY